MMLLDATAVQKITGDAERWNKALSLAMVRWQINTPDRRAMFLAQCAHESGGFKHLVESLRYSAAALLRTWPTHFTAAEAVAFAYNEEAIGNRAYGGRMGNGPESTGDGFRYRGRGIIQLTGRYNYEKCGDALGLDLLGRPALLESPSTAAQSAGWFWATHGCNELADAGNYEGITRKINGGMNGWADRQAWLVKVRQALTITTGGTQPAAPIEDRTSTKEGPTMFAALLPIIGPILAGLIPQVKTILAPPPESAQNRNLQLAETIVNAIVQATTAATGITQNAQSATEALQADPALVKTVTEAVVTSPEIMQLLEIGGGVVAAREADILVMQQDKPFWRASAVFWISVLLLPMVLWYVGSSIVGGVPIPEDFPWAAKFVLMLFGNEWSLDARAGLANLVVGLVLGGICGVYFGVSVTQAAKRNPQP